MSQRPYRIGFVSSCYPPDVVGGAELCLQSLAEELAKNGASVFVVTLNPFGVDELLNLNGVRVYRLATRNIYWPYVPLNQRSRPRKTAFHAIDTYNPMSALAVEKVLRLERPDILNTHNLCGFSTAVWGRAHALHIPVVHTLHDYYLMCYRTTRYRGGFCRTPCAACLPATSVRRQTTKRVDAVVGTSKYVLDAHLSAGFFPKSSSHVVHNGRGLFGVGDVRDKSGGARVIGYIGRIEREKGIEILLEAFGRVSGADLELHIAGRGDPKYVASLKQRFVDRRIRYLGYVKPQDFYPNTNLIVVPTLMHEPLPGAVYEPWEYGIPVVATATGGIPEVLNIGGHGTLFAQCDVDGLVSLLRCDRTYKSGGSVCQDLQSARLHFTPVRQSKQMLKIYLDAMSAIPLDGARQ